MKKFKYVGDKEEISLFGYTFQKGKVVEVADEFAQKKFAGNSHFEEVGKKQEEAK